MSYNKLIYSILCNTSFDNGKITKYDNAKHDYEDDENDDLIMVMVVMLIIMMLIFSFSSSAGTGSHMKETSHRCGNR